MTDLSLSPVQRLKYPPEQQRPHLPHMEAFDKSPTFITNARSAQETSKDGLIVISVCSS